VSGRLDQLRLDLQPPKMSSSAKATKCFMSETFSLFVSTAGKPPMLQNPIQKEDSGLGEGRGSPKGKLLGYRGAIDDYMEVALCVMMYPSMYHTDFIMNGL